MRKSVNCNPATSSLWSPPCAPQLPHELPAALVIPVRAWARIKNTEQPFMRSHRGSEACLLSPLPIRVGALSVLPSVPDGLERASAVDAIPWLVRLRGDGLRAVDHFSDVLPLCTSPRSCIRFPGSPTSILITFDALAPVLSHPGPNAASRIAQRPPPDGVGSYPHRRAVDRLLGAVVRRRYQRPCAPLACALCPH